MNYRSNSKHRPQKVVVKPRISSPLVRGFLFLLLAGIVTYYGKFRENTPKIVKKHDMVGWVFQKDSIFSLLMVLPDDNNDSNQQANGERVFWNPIKSPSWLDSNHIRYMPKDLYLLGKVKREHIRVYCSQVDSVHTLYFMGFPEWEQECVRSRWIEKTGNRLTQDWSVQSFVQHDTVREATFLEWIYQGQSMVFLDGYDLVSMERKRKNVPLILVELQPTRKALSVVQPQQDTLLQRVGVWVSPGHSFRFGEKDSSLVLTAPNQALGIRVKQDGVLWIKKLWLDHAL